MSNDAPSPTGQYDVFVQIALRLMGLFLVIWHTPVTILNIYRFYLERDTVTRMMEGRFPNLIFQHQFSLLLMNLTMILIGIYLIFAGRFLVNLILTGKLSSATTPPTPPNEQRV